MRIILLIIGAMYSGLSIGADWAYTTSTGNESYWIDKSFYKYDAKNSSVDLWTKSVTKKSNENSFYTRTKSLDRYSCSNKEYKNLAFVEYAEDGTVLKTNTNASKQFSIIFPETIAEGLWDVACSSKGKGFKFSDYQKQFVDMSSIIGN